MNPSFHEMKHLTNQIKVGIRSHKGRGGEIDASVRRRLEVSLGTDLSGVRVHTGVEADNMARTIGAAAFTSGSDIFFQSEAYDPRRRGGLHLLAHETAHVIQQTSGALPAGHIVNGILMGAPGSPDELAADQAADRVLLGIPSAQESLVGHRVEGDDNPELIIQRHASWEHRLLGDAKGVDLNAIARHLPQRQQLLQRERQFLNMWHNNTDVSIEQINAIYPDIRTVTLEKSNLLVTYGELNTLPDYMANPGVLADQPREILLPILQAVRQEGYNKINGLLGGVLPAHFKDAVTINTGWSFVDLLLETEALDILTSNIGPDHTNHYIALVARNACHFAPFTWYRWDTHYTIARDLAVQAFQASDPGTKSHLTYEAWMHHGYADHFLQDSFAAGHLVNKTLVMQWFLEYAVSGFWFGEWWAKAWIADWNKVKNATTYLQPGLSARSLYNPASPGITRDPQTAEEQPTLQQRMNISGVAESGSTSQAAAYQDYLAFLDSTVCQAASGVLHDHFNSTSLWVTSPSESTPYQIWGDDTMLNSGGGVEIASDTAHMSQQSILDILASGGSPTTAQQIRDRFPNGAANTLTEPQQPLEAWNDAQKDLAMDSLFSKVHYYAMRAVPRIGHVSIDQNNIRGWSPVYQMGDPGTGIGGYDLKSTADRAFAFDYDSSANLDHVVLYRPGTGTMWILKNSEGTFSPVYSMGDPGSGIGGYDLASSADRAFAFDYDSSGKLDHLALYRPGTGTMWILKNTVGTFSPVYKMGDPGSGIGGYDLASSADRAFAFDYDSSGKKDHMALYRPGTGTMWILKNTGGTFSPVYSMGDPGSGIGGYDLASSADRAFAFDYYSNRTPDHMALYRPGTGTFWIVQQS